MPELPEVEVIRRQLNPLLVGSIVVDSKSYHDRFPVFPKGKIFRVIRQGKWLHIVMENGSVVRVNFGMSGRFVVGMSKCKHTRWAILLDTGEQKRLLKFCDPRGFGRLEVYKGAPARQLTNPRALIKGAPIAALGPDLLSGFMVDGDPVRRLGVWRNALDTSTSVKIALMDQSRLAGLGSIYSSEACWLARVKPTLPANKLNRVEMMRLVVNVPLMLENAIRHGGTSLGDVNTFRCLYGYEGTYALNLNVYGREGQMCKRCKERIIKEVLGGRSTFSCDRCQRG